VHGYISKNWIPFFNHTVKEYHGGIYWIDVIALIVTASLNLTQNTKQIIFPGLGVCKMLKYFSYSTTCASLYLLAAIAVQRINPC
jgi:hypothetical protein